MSKAIMVINEETGEIVPTRGTMTVDALRSYAEAKIRTDLLRVQINERLRQLAEADLDIQAWESELAATNVGVAQVEDALAEAVDKETRKRLNCGISLDIGVVRVTWPKPAERLVQDVKPAVILRADPDLAAELGIHLEWSAPGPPRITVRPEKF